MSKVICGCLTLFIYFFLSLSLSASTSTGADSEARGNRVSDAESATGDARNPGRSQSQALRARPQCPSETAERIVHLLPPGCSAAAENSGRSGEKDDKPRAAVLLTTRGPRSSQLYFHACSDRNICSLFDVTCDGVFHKSEPTSAD